VATSSALALAAIVGAVLVRRASGSFAPPKTLVRTAIAMGSAIAVGSFMPWWGHLLVPLQVAVVAAVYVGVALVSGELTRADLAMVRGVLGKKRS
jgi:hypothetical protein